MAAVASAVYAVPFPGWIRIQLQVVSGEIRPAARLHDDLSKRDAGDASQVSGSPAEKPETVAVQDQADPRRKSHKRLPSRCSSATARKVHGRLSSTPFSSKPPGTPTKVLLTATSMVAAVLVLWRVGSVIWKCLTQHDGEALRHLEGKGSPRVLADSQPQRTSSNVCVALDTESAPPPEDSGGGAVESETGEGDSKPVDGFDFKKFVVPVLILYGLAFIAYVLAKYRGASNHAAASGLLVGTMVSGRVICYGLAYYGKKLCFRIRKKKQRRDEDEEDDRGADNPVFVISSTQL